MNEHEVEGRIRAALDAHANQITELPDLIDPRSSAVGRTVGPSTSRAGRLAPWLAVAAVLLVAVATMTVIHLRTSSNHRSGVSGAAATRSAPASPSISTPPDPTSGPSTAATQPITGTPVHVRTLEADGATYGIGMPIVVYFSATITNGSAFARAAIVTINGQPANGAWYFEASAQQAGYPMEAHYRLPNYWPAHSTVHLSLPIQGLSAGAGLQFDDAVTLTMSIGAAHVSTVDGTTSIMTVASDGQPVRTMPVAISGAATPPDVGTKVVISKSATVHMVGPGYDLLLPWSVRVTNSGEFIQASATTRPIAEVKPPGGGVALARDDAEWFYDFSQIGDIVNYAGTMGPTMPVWDGIGDWNVPWAQWALGGSVPTS